MDRQIRADEMAEQAIAAATCADLGGTFTYLAPLHPVQPWPDQVDARIAQLEQRVRHLERIVHRLLN